MCVFSSRLILQIIDAERKRGDAAARAATYEERGRVIAGESLELQALDDGGIGVVSLRHGSLMRPRILRPLRCEIEDPEAGARAHRMQPNGAGDVVVGGRHDACGRVICEADVDVCGVAVALELDYGLGY